MTTANTVFAGPVEAVKPLMREAKIATGQTLVAGMLVELTNGQWTAHDAAGVGGDICIIDMDTIGQQAVGDALTVGQSHAAFIPQVGYSYNLVLAASQTVAKGASLTSNGAGAVRLTVTTGAEEPLFVADEAVTTAGATGRIRVRYNPTGVNRLV